MAKVGCSSIYNQAAEVYFLDVTLNSLNCWFRIKIIPEFYENSSYNNSREYNKAIEHYLRVLAINPNYTDCHYNLGLVYLRVKNRGKPGECFEKCLIIDENSELARKKLQLLEKGLWLI